MKLHELETLTEEALRGWRNLDHQLVWGKFHSIRATHHGLSVDQIWEEVGRQVPDFGVLNAKFSRLNESAPKEPWSQNDIDTILEILSVKAFCFRSGYHKEHLCNRLKKYPIRSDQANRLREIYMDHILNRLARRETMYMARLIVPHAESRTVLLLEAWEQEVESPKLKQKCRRMRAMILNQRPDLR